MAYRLIFNELSSSSLRLSDDFVDFFDDFFDSVRGGVVIRAAAAVAATLLGQDVVGLLREEVVHHALDGDGDGRAENGDQDDQHDTGLRNQGEDAAEDADDYAAEDAQEKDAPLVTIGSVIAQAKRLERRDLLVEEEIDGEAPGEAHHDARNDHEHRGDDRADVEQTQQQEESAQVMEILLGEDRSRIDGFTASDADDGFIKTDGGADVEVGDPDSHHIEDDHQQEREEVLQTIADAVSDGLHDVEFLSCHSDSGISGLKFMQKYK